MLVSMGPMMLVDGASHRQWLSLAGMGLARGAVGLRGWGCGRSSSRARCTAAGQSRLRLGDLVSARHARRAHHHLDVGELSWWRAVRRAERKDFVDAKVSAVHWNFIVASWIGIYVLVDLVPRWS